MSFLTAIDLTIFEESSGAGSILLPSVSGQNVLRITIGMRSRFAGDGVGVQNGRSCICQFGRFVIGQLFDEASSG